MHIHPVTRRRPAPAANVEVVLDALSQIMAIVISAVTAVESVQRLMGKQ